MKRVLLILMTGFLALSVRAADPTPAAKPPATVPGLQEPGEPQSGAFSHKGVWKPVAAVLGGARVSPETLKAITLKITGGSYEVTVDGEPEPDRGTCTLDQTTNPKRMTIRSTAGPNRGRTFLAIYEMKDARSLRVCYDLAGTDFPKDFKAPKGTQLYLVGYRRQKE